MRILLDHNVDWHLVRYFPSDWYVETTRRLRWDDLDNGDLLNVAQHQFDVMLTFDKALYGQQNVPDYDIAVIVLRAYSNDLKSALSFMPDILQQIENLNPGQVSWLYADEPLRQQDQQKRRGEFAR